jgi:hypothetical protein
MTCDGHKIKTRKNIPLINFGWLQDAEEQGGTFN